MSWLEVKYLNLVSGRFRNFKKKTNSIYSFSCPLCGDSQTNTRKARGYVYERGGHLNFYCHNCGASQRFVTLLKKLDFRLYSEYHIEQLKLSGNYKEEVKVDVANDTSFELSLFNKLNKISQLPLIHPAAKYILERKIPTEYHAVFRWAPKFMVWTNDIIPKKFDDKAYKYDTGRIVIPFFNRDKKFVGYQGRCLDKTDPKYITISLDSTESMLFGLDRVNFNDDIRAFEGPLDSIFLKNSIAFIGGNFNSLEGNVPKGKTVIVFDNEPHSIETKHKMQRAIDDGYRICIWPDNITQKDVNDMLLSGLDVNHIEYIINQNTCEGMSAQVRLSAWSKV